MQSNKPIILLFLGYLTMLIVVLWLISCNTIVDKPVIQYDRALNPDSTIIVIPNLSEHSSNANRFLLNELKKVYGIDLNDKSNKKFPVLRQFTELGTYVYKDTANKVFIGVGNTFFSDSNDAKYLPPASFIIKKKGRYISITGSDDAGDFAGVEYFLNNYCGITHYMPGTLFTKYSGDTTISLPTNINVIDTPFTYNITSTGWFGTGNVDDKTNVQYWDSYWALLNSLNYTNWGSFQHTMSGLFCDSSVLHFFPSVYPVIYGKRYFPASADDQGFAPNFNSDELVDASWDIATRYFTKNPRIKTMAFSVMDGVEGYTMGGQQLIDANAKWLNGLAKLLKGRTIAYLLYSKVDGYPSFKLEDNILPITVWHLSDFDSDGWGRIDSLARFTKRVGNDDWAEGKGFIFPRIYTKMLSRYLNELKKKGIDFDYAHIEAYPNWGLDGIKYWEMGKIYRHPELNVDSLRIQFCNDLFGDGAKQMKAYFDTMEEIGRWLNNTGKGTHLFNYPEQLKLDSTRFEQVKECRKYLDAANNLAKTDIEKMRIDFFNKGFTFTEKLWSFYNTKSGKEDLKDYINKNVVGNDRILFLGNDTTFISGFLKLIDTYK